MIDEAAYLRLLPTIDQSGATLACRAILEGLLRQAVRRSALTVKLSQGYRRMSSHYLVVKEWIAGPQYPAEWFDALCRVIRSALKNTVEYASYFQGMLPLYRADRLLQAKVDFARPLRFGTLLINIPFGDGVKSENLILDYAWKPGDFADHT